MKRYLLVFLAAASILASCKDTDDTECPPFTIIQTCNPDGPFAADYQEDAQRLSLRKVFADNLPFKDSIGLDPALVERYLSALAGIHTAITTNGCDGLTEVQGLHTFPDLVMDRFLVQVDTSFAWTHEWKAGNSLTAEPDIDALINAYGITLTDFFDWSIGSYALLESTDNLNLSPLMTLFEAVPGVLSAAPDGVAGDGNDIEEVSGALLTLDLSKGWGDCPSGCTERQWWTFMVDVDNNCAVTYQGTRRN